MILSVTDTSTRRLRIETLAKDSDVPAPLPDVWVEVSSSQLSDGPSPSSCRFVDSAQLSVPTLARLPARTYGEFTEFVVDLYAPSFAERPEDTYEVELVLRDAVIDKKIFRNFTQRHQFIVPTHFLFEILNVFTLSARKLAGGTEVPDFLVRVFYLQKDRMANILARNSIWVFSTARSGSTWLSLDILCGTGYARPMDEPGFGRMFAPLDLMPERFYNLSDKPWYFQSGMDYDLKTKDRDGLPDDLYLAPFARMFMTTAEENKIWSPQNWHLYKTLLRHIVFEHVVNEWGLDDYEKVVFKMPPESHAADVIMEAFPEAFMIFLMRDGRDVMKSRFSPFMSPELAATNDPLLRLHAIAFYSHFWNFQVDIISSAFSAHFPERRLFVRYEDIRRDPLEQARMILDSVGLSMSERELARLIERTDAGKYTGGPEGAGQAAANRPDRQICRGIFAAGD